MELTTQKSNGKVPVKFLTKAIECRKADGSVEWQNVDRVRIFYPGTHDYLDKPVTDFWRRTYPEEYQRFKQSDDGIQGQPLNLWPAISPAHYEALKAINIFSVEGLADASDAAISDIMGGNDLRTKARLYIEERDKGQAVEKLHHENEELKARLEELEQLVKQKKGKNG